ncbi:unnamed protein product, partial [Fusarium graminearum]
KEASQPATIEGQFVPKRPVSSSHSATGLELSRYGAHDPTLGFPGILYRTINNWKGTSPRQTKLVVVQGPNHSDQLKLVPLFVLASEAATITSALTTVATSFILAGSSIALSETTTTIELITTTTAAEDTIAPTGTSVATTLEAATTSKAPLANAKHRNI